MWEEYIIKSANHFGEICKYIQFLSHSAMAALITASTSRKGNPAIIDRNHFKYVGNGTSLSTVFWRCSNKKCGATLTTRKSTGKLVVKDLPDHTHGNQLLEKKHRRLRMKLRQSKLEYKELCLPLFFRK